MTPLPMRLYAVPQQMQHCPRCGDLLIVRMGFRSEYISCINHKCKFKGMTARQIQQLRFRLKNAAFQQSLRRD